MKHLILVLGLVGVSGGVGAADAAMPLLRNTFSNGTVAPKFWIRTQCDVYGDQVVKTARRGGVDATPVMRAVKWTAEVPNPDAVVKLLAKASTGRLEHHIARLGGQIENYEGYLPAVPEAPQHVELRSIGGADWNNHAPEASVLVGFTKMNCL